MMDTHTYTHTMDTLVYVRSMHTLHMRLYVEAYLRRDTPTMDIHHAHVQHYAAQVAHYEALVHTMLHS